MCPARSTLRANAMSEKETRRFAARRRTSAKESDALAPARGTALNYGFLDRLLGYNLRRAQVAVFANFADWMSSYEITPGQLGTLGLIQANPGVTQTVLGEALGVKRASVVPLLDRLERRGLLVRKTLSRDRRSNALYLTPGGESLLRELQPQLAEHEREIACELSAEEVRQLQSALRRIRR